MNWFQPAAASVVTLQPQRESPPDMLCKDKFLLQSTQVAPHTDIDELPQDTVRIYLKNPCLAFTCHCRISNFILSHLEKSWILHIVWQREWKNNRRTEA